MRTFNAERTIYPYVELHSASYYSLQEAIEEESGRFYKLMSSMLFASFCMEGFVNYLGEKKFADWQKKERELGRARRLTSLLKALDMKPSLARRPFKTYKELFEFRDALVHSRVITAKLVGTLKRKVKHPPRPLTEWEKLINQKTAQRFFDDTSKMIRMMHQKAGSDRDPFATPWFSQWEIKLEK